MRFLSVTLILLIFSCQPRISNQVSEIGDLRFSFASKSADLKHLKNDSTENHPQSILISIEDQIENTVYLQHKIELIKFNDEYISLPLTLNTGNYKLTEFLVLDGDDNVLYVSPIEGSELSQLVGNPLPLHFQLAKDIVLNLKPEVLPAEIANPQDFGYATFEFDLLDVFSFQLTVFHYSEEQGQLEITEASLKIYNDGDLLIEQELDAKTNLVISSDNYSDYRIEVSKDGYELYEKTFTKIELIDPLENSIIVNLLKKSKKTFKGYYHNVVHNVFKSDVGNIGVAWSKNYFLIDLDRHGNINFEKQFHLKNSNERPTFINKIGDNRYSGLVSSYTAPYLHVNFFKLQKDGEFEFKQILMNNYVYTKVNSVEIRDDGFYILFGTRRLNYGSAKSHGLFSIMDNEGNTKTTKFYYSNKHVSFEDATLTKDNKYIAVGYSDYDIYVVKLNNYGDEIWTKTFKKDNGASSVDYTEDMGAILTGKNGKLIKIDTDGNIDWEMEFEIWTHSLIKVMSINSNYVVAYISKDKLLNLECLDNSGATIWVKRFPYVQNLTDLINDNNHIVISGSSISSNSNSYSGIILKLDSNGNLE